MGCRNRTCSAGSRVGSVGNPPLHCPAASCVANIFLLRSTSLGKSRAALSALPCLQAQPKLLLQGSRSSTRPKMQQLRKTLIDCLRTAPALRVSTLVSPAGLHEFAAAAAGRPQAARHVSTAAAGASASTSSGAAAAAAAVQLTPLTLHQARKQELRPENSGRNAFRRAWAKRLQIKVSLCSRAGCLARPAAGEKPTSATASATAVPPSFNTPAIGRSFGCNALVSLVLAAVECTRAQGKHGSRAAAAAREAVAAVQAACRMGSGAAAAAGGGTMTGRF